MRMLQSDIPRVPFVLRTLLRPIVAHDGEPKSDHDWGSVFLLANCTIIRVFACPQPPHFLPKHIPERLGILEFFWQFLLMNKEYLGPTIKKGTFVCRSTVVGDFVIGKNIIKQLDEILVEYKMPSAPARIYDPFNVIRRALKNMRNYSLPVDTQIWDEDAIMNCLDENLCFERKKKLVDIMAVEEALKVTNPDFIGFYTEEPYLSRYDKCIEKYDDLMAQAPPMVQQVASPASPKMDVIIVPEDEDQPGQSNWEEQGRKKKQKFIDIP